MSSNSEESLNTSNLEEMPSYVLRRLGEKSSPISQIGKKTGIFYADGAEKSQILDKFALALEEEKEKSNVKDKTFNSNASLESDAGVSYAEKMKQFTEKKEKSESSFVPSSPNKNRFSIAG